MPTYNFHGYSFSTVAVFRCPACGKANRKRTFREECTVNPFNVNTDGPMRTPSEVREQSKSRAETARCRFLNEPLCATCEGQLSYAERRALHERRRAGES